MILKSGKFYDDAGNVVPLEFGNKEQIKLMREDENRIACFKGGGLPVSIDMDERVVYDYQIRFHCICGHPMYREYESEESDDFTGLLNRDFHCIKCKCNFTIEADEDDATGVLIKLKP